MFTLAHIINGNRSHPTCQPVAREQIFGWYVKTFYPQSLSRQRTKAEQYQ